MPITISGSTGIAGVDGSASTPAVQGTDTNTGIAFPAADTVAVATGGTERMRVDSSGNVGIGTTPSQKLQVAGNVMVGTTSAGAALMLQNATTYWTLEQSTSNFLIANTGTERMRIDSSGNVGIGTSSPGAKLDIVTGGTGNFPLISSNSTNSTTKYGGFAVKHYTNAEEPFGAVLAYSDSGNNVLSIGGSQGEYNAATILRFYTAGNNTTITGTERARIDASGSFMVNTTSAIVGAGNTSTGFGIEKASDGCSLFISRDTNVPAYVNRNNDGALINFDRSGTAEGNVSVSGTTVSFNGGHLARWSQLPSGQRDPALLKGTVLSNLDEMCVWLDEHGNPQLNEQLNKMKISDVEGDPNVAGVFVSWDNDDQTYTDDMNVAMTGDMIIRIAQGVVVQKGDLLMSAGDGTAKPQGDDIRRSKTVAKVTSNHVTCTYADGSYCVPCVLMAC